jgi:hypothetical protein
MPRRPRCCTRCTGSAPTSPSPRHRHSARGSVHVRCPSDRNEKDFGSGPARVRQLWSGDFPSLQGTEGAARRRANCKSRRGHPIRDQQPAAVGAGEPRADLGDRDSRLPGGPSGPPHRHVQPRAAEPEKESREGTGCAKFGVALTVSEVASRPEVSAGEPDAGSCPRHQEVGPGTLPRQWPRPGLVRRVMRYAGTSAASTVTSELVLLALFGFHLATAAESAVAATVVGAANSCPYDAL